MKIYAVVNSGVEHFKVLGMYTDLEKAKIDLDYIGEEENKYAIGDETYRERWIKIEDVWCNQTQHHYDGGPFPEWPIHDTEQCWYMEKMYVLEYEVQVNTTFKDIADIVTAFQNNDSLHPFTCGDDSSHPKLVPYFVHYPKIGIGIRCTVPDCDWKQNETFFGNGSQTS